MLVTKLQNICPQEIKLSAPEKVNGKYFSSIEYGETDKPLFIQTPELFLSQEGIIFDKEENSDLYTFLRNLQDEIISLVYTNSIEFFNGRAFSLDHIAGALEDIFETRENDFLIRIEDSPVNKLTFCKVILKFDGIYFKNSNMILNYSIEKFRPVLVKEPRNIEFILENEDVVYDETIVPELTQNIDKMNFFD